MEFALLAQMSSHMRALNFYKRDLSCTRKETQHCDTLRPFCLEKESRANLDLALTYTHVKNSFDQQPWTEKRMRMERL